jgi:hypothetical protein
MKLIDAKISIRQYIRAHHNDLSENGLNSHIISLSHSVFRGHGVRGHNIRQKIRAQLVEYSRNELAKYNMTFQRPIRVTYKNRYTRPVYRPIRTMSYLFWTLVKVLCILILVFIIWYLLNHH